MTETKAPITLFKKIDLIPDQKEISFSGKYEMIFGSHYVKGHLCWDIAVINGWTGEVTRRHYSTKGNPEAKAQCLAFWTPYVEGMLAPPKSEEGDDEDSLVTLN